MRVKKTQLRTILLLEEEFIRISCFVSVSTWNSGFMFVGIIGFTWKMGIQYFGPLLPPLLVRLHGFGFTNLFKKRQANEELDPFLDWFHRSKRT